MAERKHDQEIAESISQLEKLRDHVPPMDQPRFDEAWQDMRATVQGYMRQLMRADFGDLESARPWYEGLAEAVIAREAQVPPSDAEELIASLNRITERVRQLPDPERESHP